MGHRRPSSSKVRPARPEPIEVFISHSSADALLIAAIIDLLRCAMSIQAKEIRCTSLDGYRLPGGADIQAQIRREVSACKVLLAVCSSHSMSSTYVAFELGARWHAKRPFIPLLAPDFSVAGTRGPLTHFHALQLDSSAQLLQLVDEVGRHLRRPVEELTAYSGKIEQTLSACVEWRLQQQ